MHTEKARWTPGPPLLLSLMVFIPSCMVQKTMLRPDHGRGLFEAVIHSPFYLLGWVVLVVPWFYCVRNIYKYRSSKRFRTFLSMLPVIIAAAMAAGCLLFSPNERQRFETLTGVALPKDAKILGYAHDQLLFNTTETFCFQTSPGEINTLIQQLDLTSGNGLKPGRLAGCPDPATWENATLWKRWDSNGRSFSLITNGTATYLYFVWA